MADEKQLSIIEATNKTKESIQLAMENNITFIFHYYSFKTENGFQNSGIESHFTFFTNLDKVLEVFPNATFTNDVTFNALIFTFIGKD